MGVAPSWIYLKYRVIQNFASPSRAVMGQAAVKLTISPSNTFNSKMGKLNIGFWKLLRQLQNQFSTLYGIDRDFKNLKLPPFMFSIIVRQLRHHKCALPPIEIVPPLLSTPASPVTFVIFHFSELQLGASIKIRFNHYTMCSNDRQTFHSSINYTLEFWLLTPKFFRVSFGMVYSM